ncbi:integral membrane protein [Fusarium sp. NRRL 52700]|nr:integral membrane protein [Fusarium sp. NRRL 52700]
MKEEDTRAPLILGVVISLLTLTLGVVLARVYTRAVLLRQFGADDVWAVLSMTSIASCAFAMLLGLKYGFGRHQVFLTEDEVKEYLKLFYVSVILYVVSLAAIKTTFLCQYYRAFAIRKMRIVIIVALVLVSAWSIFQIFFSKCIQKGPAWYLPAVGNIVTDIMILVIPIPVVMKLNLARRQRYVLLGIFCVGFLTCGISLVRIGYLNVKEDFTWVNIETACWSLTELCCGLLCACVATLRPLVSRYFPSTSSYSRSRQTYAANQQPQPNTPNRYHDLELQNRSHIQGDLLQDDSQTMRILCVSEFTVTEAMELANKKHDERESDDEVLLVSPIFNNPRPMERARTRPGKLPATD